MSDGRVEPQAPRRGGRSRLLTHEAIARTAFELVDAEGPDELTMGRLAAKLGVGEMTLYGYVDSKKTLIRLLPDVLMADLPPLSRVDPWDVVMESTFLTLFERFTRHSHVTETIVRAPVFSRAQAMLLEDVLDVLTAAGFSTPEALNVHRTLATYTIGYALFEIAESEPDSPRRTWVDDLPAEQFPHIVAATPLLKSRVSADQFQRGLRSVVAGFARLLVDPSREDA